MGLTAHNRKRREMEAQGQGGEVTRAQAHLDAAEKRVADLTAALAEANGHLVRMANELKAALPAEKKPAKKKAAKKKASKKEK